MANDFMSELTETLTKTAQDLTGKASRLYEYGKTQGLISLEEQAAGKLMKDLGNLIYERYEAGETFDPEVTRFCKKIHAHKEKAKALKQEPQIEESDEEE